jgi:hypothetical protein
MWGWAKTPVLAMSERSSYAFDAYNIIALQ